MAKSQSSQPDGILSTLAEADAALAAQEADLSAQLASVQEKRLSLKSVMNLFTTEGATALADAAIAVPEIVASTTPAEETPAETPTRGRRGRGAKTVEAPAKGKRGRKGTAAKPQASENWQDYLQPQFQQTSLPSAIASVMGQQPDRLFGMVELIAAIFDADLPKPVRNKARDRILNILSLGVKDGQWYRGRKGQYSVSRNAVESAS